MHAAQVFHTIADGDMDGCVNRDELVELFDWGATCAESGVCQDTIDNIFAMEASLGRDTSGDGLLTWSEISEMLPQSLDAGYITEA